MEGEADPSGVVAEAGRVEPEAAAQTERREVMPTLRIYVELPESIDPDTNDPYTMTDLLVDLLAVDEAAYVGLAEWA